MFGILVLDSWFAISVHYSFTIILPMKRKLAVFCCHTVVAVQALCMSLVLPLVGPWCVSVLFPGQNELTLCSE